MVLLLCLSIRQVLCTFASGWNFLNTLPRLHCNLVAAELCLLSVLGQYEWASCPIPSSTWLCFHLSSSSSHVSLRLGWIGGVGRVSCLFPRHRWLWPHMRQVSTALAYFVSVLHSSQSRPACLHQRGRLCRSPVLTVFHEHPLDADRERAVGGYGLLFSPRLPGL